MTTTDTYDELLKNLDNKLRGNMTALNAIKLYLTDSGCLKNVEWNSFSASKLIATAVKISVDKMMVDKKEFRRIEELKLIDEISTVLKTIRPSAITKESTMKKIDDAAKLIDDYLKDYVKSMQYLNCITEVSEPIPIPIKGNQSILIKTKFTSNEIYT